MTIKKQPNTLTLEQCGDLVYGRASFCTMLLIVGAQALAAIGAVWAFNSNMPFAGGSLVAMTVALVVKFSQVLSAFIRRSDTPLSIHSLGIVLQDPRIDPTMHRNILDLAYRRGSITPRDIHELFDQADRQTFREGVAKLQGRSPSTDQ